MTFLCILQARRSFAWRAGLTGFLSLALLALAPIANAELNPRPVTPDLAAIPDLAPEVSSLLVCGNGTVEPGEACDDGSQNGTSNSCCTNACTFSGKSPDVIVGDLVGRTLYGAITAGGVSIEAFAIGTTSCNLGSCWLNWYQNDARHPVIGQNMFRLKSGRFEQIGQAWLKHGFTALAGSVCSNQCDVPPDGTHLGVNCSDPYNSGLNGTQTRMGPKFEVNPVTGVYPFPATNESTTGNAIFKRLQVRTSDLDPAQNVGAQYWVDGQYVTLDDATAKNQSNNVSYRTISVSACTAGCNNAAWDIALTGSTQRMKAAIEAWPLADPTVNLTNISVPGDGRMLLGTKVTDLGGGLWHYEYAFYNQTNSRAVGSFSVPLPFGAHLTNIGFHDVDYHSGEPFVGTDWTPTVSASSITWACVPYALPETQNALRWGTLYNFRFDADVPPGTYNVTAGLFRPGTPTSFVVSTLTPTLCNGDGICQPGETCAICATDCSAQGGGPGCCGNGSCEAGENPCRCSADCGFQQGNEFSCGNNIDDDCDGSTDCADVDCCVSPACAGVDHDGDSYPCDCNDANPLVWATPGEALNLMVTAGQGVTNLSWTAPAEPGAVSVTYDLIRSSSSADFVSAATCMFLPDASVPAATDASNPNAGHVYYYRARAKNGCPSGVGPLGYDSNNQIVAGRTCP